ncbi:MAG: DapH/DapD/GlmU-related protein [Methanocellales archaeon]
MILENAIIGYPTSKILQEIAAMGLRIEEYNYRGSEIGENALIRSNSIIYCDVKIGRNLKTGHGILIRENTEIGDNVMIGTGTIIEGFSKIGSNVSLQSRTYIPMETVIEDYVFIGPGAVLTNDKYPIRKKEKLKGPILRRGASIGANATILPGVEIGEGAMVAAGALVAKDVPAWHLAIGIPARNTPLSKELMVLNAI